MAEKTTVMQVRLPEKLKKDFEGVCKAIGTKQPSVQVRELIEKFVREQYERLGDRLIIDIYRPEGYDFGAWRVSMILRDPTEGSWRGSPIPFRLPQLPSRNLVSDKGFEAIVGVPSEENFVEYKLGGVFVDGRWFGHLYTNGCPEGENPTSIEKVRDELAQGITQLLDKFSGTGR